MKLSGVMILGFLSMTIGQLIEVFYIGQVGKLELAAIAFTFPITMSLNALTRGIGIGASTIIAQAMGEGDRDKTAMTVTHCYWLVLAFTGSVAVAGQWLADDFFALLGARDEVLILATSYAHIWLIGFPMMGIAMTSNGMVRSYGNATYPGFIMSSAPLVQVTAGPFLIFGWAGFPALGLDGAGYAFVCGTVAQMLLVGYWYLIREKLFSPDLHALAQSSRNILRVGIPAAATNLIQPVSIGVTTWLLAGFGNTVVAGFGVASRIESVVGMVVIGISTAIVPLVGQNWGARKFARAYEAMRTCYIACLVWGAMAATIMWLGAPFFVAVINSDESLVDVAVMFLYIVPLSIGFLGLINVATHSFNALLQPVPALMLSITRLVIVYLPLAFIGGQLFGYVGVFAATAITNVTVGVVAVLWNRRAMKKDEAAKIADDGIVLSP